MNHLIEYKPLTEAIAYSGKKYFKSCTKEEFAELQAKNESIYFDVSKTFARSAHIADWKDADPEDVMIEWECVNLTARQRAILNIGIKSYLKTNPTKTVTQTLVRTMLERVKNGENPYR